MTWVERSHRDRADPRCLCIECATAKLAERNARIAELEEALARASRTELFLRSERPIARRVTELEAALREARECIDEADRMLRDCIDPIVLEDEPGYADVIHRIDALLGGPPK